MDEWGIILAVVVVGILTNQAIYRVGAALEKRLDELNEKVDTLQRRSKRSNLEAYREWLHRFIITQLG
jgi:hypothetical protein